jgi:uncharacterized membrane protein
MAVVLPVVVSLSLVIWVFGTIAGVTDILLIFVPRKITHHDQGAGPMFWYWSLAALGVALCFITLVGVLARNYFGKRIIRWVDSSMLRVPLVKKIYSATKQVNEAFSSNNKTAFRTVVLLEFPRSGSYTLGFLTSEEAQTIQARPGEKLVAVFVPTTPNPTGGYLLLVPKEKVQKLDMSVAEGIKYVISLGAITPDAALAPGGSPIPALVSASPVEVGQHPVQNTPSAN